MRMNAATANPNAVNPSVFFSDLGVHIGNRASAPPFTYALDFESTAGIRLPRGTTAQRGVGAAGYFGYNTTWSGYDVHNGTAFRRLLDLPDATPTSGYIPVYTGGAWTTAALTAASVGAVDGTGTASRIMQWSDSDTAMDAPIENSGGVTRFTQTTAIGIPTGGTAVRPAATAARIRHNSDTGQFEGSRNGSTWEQFAMGQVYAQPYIGITSGLSISPTSSMFVQAVIASGSATLTIDDAGVPAGAYMDVINSGAGTLILDRVSGTFIDVAGSYATISLTDQTARLVYSGYSWYVISIQ